MIDRIVVPLDRSALSEIAIPFGTTLARIFDARIEYLCVVPEQGDLETASADQYLAEITEQFPVSTVSSAVVRMGSPAEVIVAEASDPGAMIVMATHGHGGLKRMIIGSVADSVVRTANVPVALIRGGIKAGTIPEPIRNILVPMDGSNRAASALPLAIDLACNCGAHLHLLQVVLPVSVTELGYATDTSFLSPNVYADMMDDLERSAQDDLDSAKLICERAGVGATTHVLVGTPGDDILRVAAEVAADVIVMASRGRGGARRMVMGSVANGLVQHSNLPLIVVPPRAQLEATADDSDDERIRTSTTTARST